MNTDERRYQRMACRRLLKHTLISANLRLSVGKSPAGGTLFQDPPQPHAAFCWRPVVSIDTTTSVKKPRGIVRIPGWLNGTIAAAASRP